MSVWRYEGKRVVVSGGGGAGMGAAAVTELANLGAEIHVIDLKEPPVTVASHQVVDLRDPDAAAAAIESIGGTHPRAVQLRGPARPAVLRRRHDAGELRRDASPRGAVRRPHDRRRRDLQHLVERAGMGYLQQIEKWMPLVETEGFAAAKEWCEANPEEIAGGTAVEGGDHPLDDTPRPTSRSATSGVNVHQPRPDRHADDAGVRGALGHGAHRHVHAGSRAGGRRPRSRHSR